MSESARRWTGKWSPRISTLASYTTRNVQYNVPNRQNDIHVHDYDTNHVTEKFPNNYDLFCSRHININYTSYSESMTFSFLKYKMKTIHQVKKYKMTNKYLNMNKFTRPTANSHTQHTLYHKTPSGFPIINPFRCLDASSKTLNTNMHALSYFGTHSTLQKLQYTKFSFVMLLHTHTKKYGDWTLQSLTQNKTERMLWKRRKPSALPLTNAPRQFFWYPSTIE